MLEDQGKQEIELNKRFKKVNKVYYAMRWGFTNKKDVSEQIKMKVCKAIFRHILTYGC